MKADVQQAKQDLRAAGDTMVENAAEDSWSSCGDR